MKNINVMNNPISEKTAVALGIFDGVHLGHRAVISTAVNNSDSLSPAVFTFNTDSLELKHGKEFRYICNNKSKMQIIEQLGVKYIYSPDFSDIKDMTAEEFVSEIMCRKMNVHLAVCGQRFRFGKNAEGNSDLLHKLGEKYGFKVITINPVTSDGENISSTIIRSYITAGEIETANKLLGKNYSISSEVVYGNQLGRTIGIPTINQNFDKNQLIPCYGAYASRTIIDGTSYPSVTNIGVKPTVENNNIPLAESHIIGYSGNLYGKNPEVIFDKLLRKEKKFSSVDELKQAIMNDIKTVQAYANQFSK